MAAGPSILHRWHRGNGGGNAARPTVRIPYAEREPATGREVLLDCRQAKSTRPELAPGPAGRPVERAQWSDSTTGLPERIVRGDSPPQNKSTTRGEGGPFIRSRRGEPGSVGRGNFIRALRTRHRHYNKQSKFRQSLESKKMNRFQIVI